MIKLSGFCQSLHQQEYAHKKNATVSKQETEKTVFLCIVRKDREKESLDIFCLSLWMLNILTENKNSPSLLHK